MTPARWTFAALIPVGWVLFSAAGQPAQCGTISFNHLNLVGAASLVDQGTVLRLTPNHDLSGSAPAGAAWLRAPALLGLGFSTSFQFRLWGATGDSDPYDGSGGDGFAFVVQNSPDGAEALGQGAGGLGYMFIANSVAVEFDTYQNQSWYGDPDGNHISVHTRGAEFNVPHHLCTNGLLRSTPDGYTDLPDTPCASDPSLGSTWNLSTNLADGAIHTATLFYNPGQLTLALDSQTVLSVPLDLAGAIGLEPGRPVYVGFTAGTRASYQNQDILNWSYARVPEPGTLLLLGSALLALSLGRRLHRKSAQ